MKTEKTVEQLQAENDALRAAIAEQNSTPGAPAGLEADIKRRVQAGLPLNHAIQAAISQKINDDRIAKEEAAEKAKAAEAAKEASAREQLAAAEKKIAALEAKLKKEAQG
jgi:predicted RNase H-like nuclease (RuvC/YqgF family)